MSRHEDHPFIKQKRRALGIPDDADFLTAFVEKTFVQGGPAARAKELEAFDAAQTHDKGLRSESQLYGVRRDLRAIDAAVRRAGR